MKILGVCSNYYPAHGGPQYVMKHLAEKFVEYYGDEVEIATSDSLYGPEQNVYKKITPNKENINGVVVNRYAMYRWHYNAIDFIGKVHRRLFKKPLTHSIRKYRWELHSPGINTKMINSDADVIFAKASPYMYCDYPFWRAKTQKSKPFVLYGALHLHINWKMDSPVIKRTLACDCYVANTEYERQEIIKMGMDAHKIITTGIGIEVEEMYADNVAVQKLRQQYGILDTDILIGHIGRLSEGKGVGVLYEAFIELSKTNKNVKLLLAGTTTEYSISLKAKLAGENINIIFLEDFDNKLKPLLFNAIDIFVLASKGESFGVVFLEAWACKKPVIGTNMQALQSVIANEKDGLLFNSGDAIDLSKKLNELVINNKRRLSMGENGYKKIQALYTWPIVIGKWKLACEKAINNFQSKK